jgi:leucyl-tRNA synthetase
MTKAIVTTAFPYLNGKLHQGHRYSYFIFEGISKILKGAGYKVLKPFSFHTTGVSLISNPNKYFEDPKLPEEIKKDIFEGKWTSLLDFYKEDLIKKFNLEGIELDPSYFEYTHNSERYQIFLDSCFKKFEKYLNLEKHCVIFCPNCNWVLGDHDRSKGESATIIEKGRDELCYIIEDKKYYISEEVTCKCGTNAILKLVEDWFIDYKAAVPEKLFFKNISRFPEDLKTPLVSKYRSLRKWCITRDRGLGPTFLLDRNKILEPLSDSAFYPYYYLLKDLEPVVDNLVKINPSYFENHYHIAGKDLLENHILFSILWEIFLLGSCKTNYIITGHLLLNGAKMSKTLGNIIPFEEKTFTIEQAFWSVNSYEDLVNPLKLNKIVVSKKKYPLIHSSLTLRNQEYHKIRRSSYFLNTSEGILLFKDFYFIKRDKHQDLVLEEIKLKEIKERIKHYQKMNKKVSSISLPLSFFNRRILSKKRIEKQLKVKINFEVRSSVFYNYE